MPGFCTEQKVSWPMCAKRDITDIFFSLSLFLSLSLGLSLSLFLLSLPCLMAIAKRTFHDTKLTFRTSTWDQKRETRFEHFYGRIKALKNRCIWQFFEICENSMLACFWVPVVAQWQNARLVTKTLWVQFLLGVFFG